MIQYGIVPVWGGDSIYEVFFNEFETNPHEFVVAAKYRETEKEMER